MTKVFLYVPNLIGYARILTGIACFSYALPLKDGSGQPVKGSEDTWKVAIALYCFSYWLDALDGVAARRLNQCSRFGAVLDMITDRFCTMGLLTVLSHLYPSQYTVFILLQILDIVSHWCQMYSSLLSGSGSHKTSAKDKDVNFILRFYYSFPYALFFLCAFNEGFLVGLYLLKFTSGPMVPFLGVPLWVAMTWFCLPWFLFKQYISVVQLFTSAVKIAEFDEKPKAA